MIEVQELTKHYDMREVVSRVSFHVARGELLVLVGGSGSGKTTTLKLINRLIEPTSGRVLIEGEDAHQFEPHLLRRQIGYVPQGSGLFPHLTVAENIEITLSLLGWSSARRLERRTELMALVELSESTASRYPAELSGGQAQRVSIARALAARPRFMLLDEPFGSLDPLTRDRLVQAFAKLKTQLNLTAVFVTHDMTEALMLGDQIAVLRDGTLLQVGKARELLESPKDPYVEQLFDTPLRQARTVDRLLSEVERA
jgi:osmoprotectant transport system ATP-binding protein